MLLIIELKLFSSRIHSTYCHSESAIALINESGAAVCHPLLSSLNVGRGKYQDNTSKYCLNPEMYSGIRIVRSCCTLCRIFQIDSLSSVSGQCFYGFLHIPIHPLLPFWLIIQIGIKLKKYITVVQVMSYRVFHTSILLFWFLVHSWSFSWKLS